MPEKNLSILSVESLIQQLEHIELDQLSSDIPANILAELTRISHNNAAILAFLGTFSRIQEMEGLIGSEVKELRKECIALNITVMRLRLFYWLRMHSLCSEKSTAIATQHYEVLRDGMRRLCEACAPQLQESLAMAL
jgi:hypothetical protein